MPVSERHVGMTALQDPRCCRYAVLELEEHTALRAELRELKQEAAEARGGTRAGQRVSGAQKACWHHIVQH